MSPAKEVIKLVIRVIKEYMEALLTPLIVEASKVSENGFNIAYPNAKIMLQTIINLNPFCGVKIMINMESEIRQQLNKIFFLILFLEIIGIITMEKINIVVDNKLPSIDTRDWLIFNFSVRYGT